MRRLDGHDDLPGTDATGAVLDHQLVALRDDPRDPAARPRAVAEALAELRGQPAGAAGEVAGDQRALAAPDEREEPEPATGRELVELGGGAVRGTGEDPLDRRRQRPEEVAEAAVVLEAERPPAQVGGRVTGLRAQPAVVAPDRPLYLQARRRERQPLARRERQPQRIALDAAAGQLRAPDRQPHHAPVDRQRVQPARARHRVDGRPGAREQVRPEVQPVVPARLRAQPAAEPVAGLEQQDVVLAQAPRRRQAGDPAADHDHVPSLVVGRHQVHRRHRRRAASPLARVGSLADSKAELVSLQQIRCFCAAAELGSFTAAAAALRVSQPAVAEQVRRLEQRAGRRAVRPRRPRRGPDRGRAGVRRARRRHPADARGRRGQRRRADGRMDRGVVALGAFSAPLGLAAGRARGRASCGAIRA